MRKVPTMGITGPGSPFDAFAAGAGSGTRLVLLVDPELIVRAAGGGTRGEAAGLRGLHLRDVFGRVDLGLEAAVRTALVRNIALRHPLPVGNDGAPGTVDAGIAGLLDQQGRRLAVIEAVVASPGAADAALGLSPREAEILALAGQGLRVATIARTLDISPSTVRNHLSAIFRKAQVKNQAELIEWLRGPAG